MGAQAYNLNTWEAEAGGWRSSLPGWGYIERHHLKTQAHKCINCSKSFESCPAFLKYFIVLLELYFISVAVFLKGQALACHRGAERTFVCSGRGTLVSASRLLHSWELPGFVSLSWQPLGQEGGGEKGGLVADLGNREILKSTDGHSAWAWGAQCSPQKASGGWPWATQESRWEKGELRGNTETAVV